MVFPWFSHGFPIFPWLWLDRKLSVRFPAALASSSRSSDSPALAADLEARQGEMNHFPFMGVIYIPLASKPYKFVGCKLKPWV